MSCLRIIFWTVHLCFRIIFMTVHVFTSCLQLLVPCVKPSSVKTNTETTVNEKEVKKFQGKAQKWWDSETFNTLFAMNALRVPFITDGLLQLHSAKCDNRGKPLTGFTILDVGCGGGILAEALARLGAHVTGIDPAEESIKVAVYHSSLDPEVRDNLEYICSSVEDYSKGSKKYDAVVCSEVVEHVDNVPYFVEHCTNLAKNNGSVFFTTINRTAFSYIYAILLAEYVLCFIQRGAHEWSKFIKPDELKLMLQSHNCKIVSVRGTIFSPFVKKFFWTSYQGGFYALHAVKEIPEGRNALKVKGRPVMKNL